MNALPETPSPWKILIVDDDPDVHAATRLALRGVSFRGRGLEFISAYSGRETLTCLQAHPDTAVIFLDVIMETGDAGLGAAREIREQGFTLPRLIIRTGHPGQAPEREVIVNYDIHDYKEKSGLSAQKLFTSLISALRAYADLVALEKHRRGLLSVLETVSWFDFDDVQRYFDGMLLEFSALARLAPVPLLLLGKASRAEAGHWRVLAAGGAWPEVDEVMSLAAYPADVQAALQAAAESGRDWQGADCVVRVVCAHDVDLLVYAADPGAFAAADAVLLDVFFDKVCQALANHHTFVSVRAERDALLQALALASERWDGDAASALPRLAALCRATAERLALTLTFPDDIDSQFLRDIGPAAMLHDLGNLQQPALWLQRAGPLNAEEANALRQHVADGVRLLAGAARPADGSRGLLQLASEAIAAHHERYDGSGYPAGLAGDAIPLPGRLLAVVDAYVTMTSPRPWRAAMPPALARAEIEAGSGRIFDPLIVQAFLQVLADESGN